MLISIGVFIGNQEGLDYVNSIGKDYPIHLGFFNFKDFYDYASKVNSNVQICSVHLPAIIHGYNEHNLIEMLDWFWDRQLVTPKSLVNAVIHPNYGIYNALRVVSLNYEHQYLFCIENFPYKKSRKKLFRNPMEILAEYLCLNNYGMCLDTDHLDQEWYRPSILHSLLNYVNIIHLSNKREKSHHRPFRDGYLDLKDVLRIIKDRELDMEITLEYMVEFKKQSVIFEDFHYLEKYFTKE